MKIWAIVISAILSLIVGVLTPVIVKSWINSVPKISYEVISAVPIEIGDKKIGTYLIKVKNASSKTIQNVTISIQLANTIIKNGGIQYSKGLKLESQFSEGGVEITIPLFCKEDEISVPLYAESPVALPKTPEVSIRSPEEFNLLSQPTPISGDKIVKITSLASVVVAIVSMLTMPMLFQNIKSRKLGLKFFESQKNILVFSAIVNGLYEQAVSYACQTELTYYTEGDMAYAKAVIANDSQVTKKMIGFLCTVIDITADIGIAHRSKCVILYNLAKLQLLNKDEVSCKKYLNDALSISESVVLKRMNYDTEIRAYAQRELLVGGGQNAPKK